MKCTRWEVNCEGRPNLFLQIWPKGGGGGATNKIMCGSLLMHWPPVMKPVHLDMLYHTQSLSEPSYEELRENYEHLGKKLNKFLQGVLNHHKEPYR